MLNYRTSGNKTQTVSCLFIRLYAKLQSKDQLRQAGDFGRRITDTSQDANDAANKVSQRLRGLVLVFMALIIRHPREKYRR
ncbi:MAG: hypothetical protein ACLPSL_13285 [Smithella sp.]